MGDSDDRAGSKEDAGSNLADLISTLWRQGLRKANGKPSQGTGKTDCGASSDTLAHDLQELCDGHHNRITRPSSNHLPPGPQS
jgi:hypothetical protein